MSDSYTRNTDLKKVTLLREIRDLLEDVKANTAKPKTSLAYNDMARIADQIYGPFERKQDAGPGTIRFYDPVKRDYFNERGERIPDEDR